MAQTNPPEIISNLCGHSTIGGTHRTGRRACPLFDAPSPRHVCLFTLLGSSAGAQVADADWLTYNRHPAWRSVLASQGDQPFQRRPIEGDLHVYAARGVLASDRSACC